MYIDVHFIIGKPERQLTVQSSSPHYLSDNTYISYPRELTLQVIHRIQKNEIDLLYLY